MGAASGRATRPVRTHALALCERVQTGHGCYSLALRLRRFYQRLRLLSASSPRPVYHFLCIPLDLHVSRTVTSAVSAMLLSGVTDNYSYQEGNVAMPRQLQRANVYMRHDEKIPTSSHVSPFLSATYAPSMYIHPLNHSPTRPARQQQQQKSRRNRQKKLADPAHCVNRLEPPYLAVQDMRTRNTGTTLLKLKHSVRMTCYAWNCYHHSGRNQMKKQNCKCLYDIRLVQCKNGLCVALHRMWTRVDLGTSDKKPRMGNPADSPHVNFFSRYGGTDIGHAVRTLLQGIMKLHCSSAGKGRRGGSTPS
ncbi:uncharacterized protein [Dermacentor andersoni]|uniref:uncharacterized protein n=1 Tax=Dermacentor andersoni TaxID=34620 RepID=UPI00241688EB|nr:uncharacterized protein LOC126547805 [Dermacentor andersoni]